MKVFVEGNWPKNSKRTSWRKWPWNHHKKDKQGSVLSKKGKKGFSDVSEALCQYLDTRGLMLRSMNYLATSLVGVREAQWWEELTASGEVPRALQAEVRQLVLTKQGQWGNHCSDSNKEEGDTIPFWLSKYPWSLPSFLFAFEFPNV